MSLADIIQNIANNIGVNLGNIGENFQEAYNEQVVGEPEQQEGQQDYVPPQMTSYTQPFVEEVDRKIEPVTYKGFENLTTRLAADTDKPDLVSNEPKTMEFGDESSVRRIFSPEESIENLRTQDQQLNPNVTAFESAAQQYRDENAQRLFDQEQQEREDFQRTFDNDAINQSWGQMGFDYSQDPLYQQQVENAQAASFDPSGVSEEFRRRIFDQNGDIKNPLNWNIMGLSSQSQTSPGARAMYESYFDRQRGDNGVVSRGAVSPTLIDDGHSAASREAMYMTGEQYINYRNAGIPGRDIYDIDPNEIYSKQDEMETSGFIPYITNEVSQNNFSELADANELNNAFQHLANARRENTDFGVNFEGRQYSGAELQRAIQPFQRRLNEQVNDQSRIVNDRDQASEFAVPHVPQYHIRDDASGQVQDYDGEPVVKERQADGKIYFEWADGTWARFADEDDVRSSMTMNYRPANDGEEDQATMWLELDPLTLADGTQIRADKAQQLFSQLGNEEALDYGPLGWGRQSVEGPGQGFLPWVTDMALGSMPLFWWPTSIAQAGGQTMSSATGMRPGSDNFINGTYSMLSDRPTEEQRTAATVGSAIMPFTERLYGNIGGNLATKVAPRPVRNFFNNIEKTHPGLQYLAGTAGEALEEIPGNLVEEMMQGNGPAEFYADEVTDENGNMLRNEQGMPIRDRNTDAMQRVRNFIADAPDALLGGAVLGGVLGFPSVAQYNRDYQNYHNRYLDQLPNRDQASFTDYWNYLRRNQDADNVDYANDIVVPLSDSEINYYNR